MKNKINLNLYKLTLKQLIIPATILAIVCVVISVTNLFSSEMTSNMFGYNRYINVYGTKVYNGQLIAAAIAPSIDYANVCRVCGFYLY